LSIETSSSVDKPTRNSKSVQKLMSDLPYSRSDPFKFGLRHWSSDGFQSQRQVIHGFAVCLLNPYSSLVNSNSNGDEVSQQSTARSLLSFDSLKMTASTTIATLIIQALMFLLLFVKIFIYGEKVTDQESVKSSLKKYWMHKKQAELTPNNPRKAMSHLELALEAIGRPMPQSKFEWIASGIW
jgi:hypothetical protein